MRCRCSVDSIDRAEFTQQFYYQGNDEKSNQRTELDGQEGQI